MSYVNAAKAIAKSLGINPKELTMSLIKKAPVPVRYKKLFQGQTAGEAKMVPSAKSSRAMAAQEAKSVGAFAAVTGGSAIIKKILEAAKNPNIENSSNLKGRNKPRTPVNKAIDSAKKATKPKAKPMPRPKARPKKLAPMSSLKPKARPK